jgi:hypothetical protein
MKKAPENNDNLDISEIFIKDAKFSSDKLDDDDNEVNELIDNTLKKQSRLLNLNKMDQEELRTVVQL